MKLAAIILLAAYGIWTIKPINPTEAIVINNSNDALTCYMYYMDGSYTKRHVPRHGQSTPFPTDHLDTVDCV
jgi:hypothetical protein